MADINMQMKLISFSSTVAVPGSRTSHFCLVDSNMALSRIYARSDFEKPTHARSNACAVQTASILTAFVLPIAVTCLCMYTCLSSYLHMICVIDVYMYEFAQHTSHGLLDHRLGGQT
jgi:hypothetical protein